MRKNLENFEWHTYGLKPEDLDYTFDLVKNIIDDRRNQLHFKFKEFEAEHGVQLDEEASFDEVHYNYTENLALWHFALWRLQGIFEGILKEEFLEKKEMQGGLKIKLQTVRNKGFSIAEADFQELQKWGKLRNALSHFPPEQFRPGTLEQEDIEEYLSLVKRVIQNLFTQIGKKK